MTNSERHARLAELFLEAVQRSEAERTAFLERECAGDAELLETVTKLLAEDVRGPVIPDDGDVVTAARPAGLSGQTVSHYRVLEPIATGGMAMLYRALDIRLERFVALKFLPTPSRIDPASHEMFLREARAIASIDHPNVCTVYEIEEAEGAVFIAMAFLEGIPLDQRLKRGRVRPAEAVEIALQIARGLEAAHARGIVHRDIKPSNVILTPSEGRPALARIVDFGVVQWTQRPDLAQCGLTAGTPAYMAPEQVLQPQVDPRADIWSLGVVLYEMLAGHRPFESDSVRGLLAAIAGPEPPRWDALPSDVPFGVLALLERLLEKNPERRCPSAAAVVQELELLAGDKTQKRPGDRRRERWIVAAVTAATLFFAVSQIRVWDATRNRDELKVTPITFYPGHERQPAISPDGKQIAFVAEGLSGSDRPGIYLSLIGSTNSARLTDVPAGHADSAPAWHPDGKSLAFLRAPDVSRFARIRTITVPGAVERDVDVERVIASGGIDWSPDGRSLLYTALDLSGRTAIFEIELKSRRVEQRSFPAQGQFDCCPVFDPSGNRIAFRRNEVDIFFSDRRKRSEHPLGVRTSWPGLAWSADGRSIVYSWFGGLTMVDLAKGTVRRPVMTPGTHVSEMSIRGSRMAFVRWDLAHSIWKMDIQWPQGHRSPRSGAAPAAPLIRTTVLDDTPHFSPDGEWLAFVSERSGSNEIWLGRRDGSALRRLTYGNGASAGTPRWSPDGKWIAFDLRRPSSKPEIHVVNVANGATRLVNAPLGGADMPSWSRDGRWIYYHMRSDDQIWKIPAEGGNSVQLTRRHGFEAWESFDGEHLYYSKLDGVSGIWRLNLTTGVEQPVPELSDAAEHRHWALSRNGIYFVPNTQASNPSAELQFFGFADRRVRRVAPIGRLATAGPGALAVSEDESAVLFVRVDRDNRDIMLVEDFR